jgi:Sec-independent protein translocase protein TatA
MSYTVGVLLSIAAVAVIIAALVEVTKYFRGQTIISGRQLLLRLVMAVLLLAIIGLGFWGKIYLTGGSPDPMTVATAVGLAIVMIVAVVVLALVDLRQVMAAQHRARAELYERLADMRQEIEELTNKARQSQDKAEQDPDTES